MSPRRYFMDTHASATGTFPEGLSPADLDGFLEKYQTACREEGVELQQVSANLDEGRAFCLSVAADADAVRRAHEKVGLPIESIVEVELANLQPVAS